MEKATNELAAAKADKDAIERQMMRLRKYARYLEDVVSAAARGLGGVAEAFDNPSHILTR